MHESFESKTEIKKSLLFFTHAPEGTLGDPSAAAKLIKDIIKIHGDSIKIHMCLVVHDSYKNKVIKVFNGLPISIVTVSKEDLLTLPGVLSKKKGVASFMLYAMGDKTKPEVLQLKDILTSTEGIIFFPTFHMLTELHMETILSYKKPAIVITEYDLFYYNRLRQADLLKLDTKSSISVINTGLKEDAIGIFCTKESVTSNCRNALLEINDSADLSFRDFLLGAKDTPYHDSHQLFFGYFNQAIDGESARCYYDSAPTPLLLIELGLATVPENINTVDFVLPYGESSFFEEKESSMFSYRTRQELSYYFAKNPGSFSGYSIEFWKKNEAGDFVCVEKSGTGNKLIRIINGFPFSQNTILKILKASCHLGLGTGDSSIAELISHKKNFLYQTMLWKVEFRDSLIASVKQQLGDKSALFQFLQMQTFAHAVSKPVIISFFVKNEKQLLEEMKTFSHYLFEHKNLYKNLTPKLFSYFKNPNKIKSPAASSSKASTDVMKVPNFFKKHDVDSPELAKTEDAENDDEDRIDNETGSVVNVDSEDYSEDSEDLEEDPEGEGLGRKDNFNREM